MKYYLYLKYYIFKLILQVVGRNISILLRSKYVDKTSGIHHSLETLYQAHILSACVLERRLPNAFLSSTFTLYAFLGERIVVV